MQLLVALLTLIGVSLNSGSAAAGKSSVLRADRIQISYVPPKNSAHEAIFQLLKERRILEKFKGLLSALRLPRALLLRLRDAMENPTPGMEMTPSLFATSTLKISCGTLPRKRRRRASPEWTL